MWEAIIRALFWSLWIERSNRIFNNKARDVNTFIDFISLTAITWSHRSPFL